MTDIESFITQHEDLDNKVLIATVEAVEKRWGERAVEILIGMIDQSGVHGKKTIAQLLGEIGDLRAIGPLIDLLRSDRNAEDEETWIEMSIYASSALAAIGNSALLPLVQSLKDESSQVRAGAADALGKLGSAQAVEPLIGLLSDSDKQVRLNSIAALGEIGERVAIKPLLSSLTDEDESIRHYGIRALGKISDPQVIEPLIRILQEGDTGDRSQAAYALGDTGRPGAREPLLYALRDAEGEVRAAAASALGKVGDEHVLPILEWMQQNDHGRNRANPVKNSVDYAITCIQARLRAGPPPTASA